MKQRTKLIIIIASLAVSLAAFLWLLTTKGPLSPVGVHTSKVFRANLSPSVFGIGTVDARLAYAVGPIAPGRVMRVLVDQGDTVKAGQLLAEMDPVDLDRRVQAAQSAGSRSRNLVEVVEAQVAEAANRVRLTQLNRDRDLRLLQEKVISKQTLDNSGYEAEAAMLALATARANAASAKQDIQRTDAELRAVSSLRESLRLISPADGVIVSREAEPGTTVVAGQAVLRLVVPSSLWVRTRIDQSRAQGVRVGQTASIVLRSSPDVAMSGKVTRIEMQSDSVTEERVVNVSFDPPPANLYLGELAEVTIQLPAEANVLIVPSAAIARDSGQTGVWQLVDGRAVFKPVSIGSQAQAGLTQILSGLSVDESIIVYSTAELKNGVRVREQKVEQP